MSKQYKTHKEQLCTGTMQWVQLLNKYGSTVHGWQCDICGKTLPTYKNPLHHVAIKKDISR